MPENILKINKQHEKKEKKYFSIILKNIVHKIKSTNDFDIILKKYFLNIFKLLLLDFHGVSDLYDLSEKIPSTLPKCIISYIGNNKETLKNTINTINQRIINNEILLGIIVYNKSNYPTYGTKGWIIDKISSYNNNMILYFIDDSIENINCVNNLNNNNIKTVFINKKKNPKKYLSNILLKIDNIYTIE